MPYGDVPYGGNGNRPVRYSVIILAFNGLVHTVRCLQSLIQFAPSCGWEIIVVDNASSDGTRAWLQAFAEQHPDIIRLVLNEENHGFSRGCNDGALVAQGEWLCFLNNDTVVTQGWLERLQVCAEETGAGMVGPMSSNSNGRQMVHGQFSGDARPETVNAFAQQWAADHPRAWSPTGILYGWCILMRHAVWEAVGPFDERFVNGHEDNDLSLRAQRAGITLMIAGDVFIHHHGQGTLLSVGTMDEYALSGVANEQRFHDKWHDPAPQQLVAVMRVANCERTIEQVLDTTATFATAGIIVHLCRSQDRTEAICRAHPAVIQVGVYDGPFQEDYERGWLLEQALAMQANGTADWCISVDGDELYEPKFAQRVQALMHPRNPHTHAYFCNWRTIWEREGEAEFYRADGIFGGFMNYRFWRLFPGQVITSEHPEGHHCGSAPVFPPENLGWVNLRVKHLGYDTKAQRERKHAFYTREDHFKTAADIGNADYHHLVDQTVHLRRYREDQSVSAVILCRDEWGYLRGLLRLLEPLVDEFVIVDTGSVDETLAELERFGARASVPVRVFSVPWEHHFARTRNFGVRQARSRWILHMDPDEAIDHTDVQVLAKMLDEDCEAFLFDVINYLEPYLPASGKPPVYATSETIRLFRNIPELYYSGVVHESLEDALQARKVRGHGMILQSPVKIHHRGYLRPKTFRDRKFLMYEAMNQRQMVVTQGQDPRPFFNLALHYMNDSRMEEAVEHMRRAAELGPTSWRVQTQLAALYMTQCREQLARAVPTIPEGHPFRDQAEQMVGWMAQHGLKQVKL